MGERYTGGEGTRTRDSEPEHLLDHLGFKTFNHCLWLRAHRCHGMHTHITLKHHCSVAFQKYVVTTLSAHTHTQKLKLQRQEGV